MTGHKLYGYLSKYVPEGKVNTKYLRLTISDEGPIGTYYQEVRIYNIKTKLSEFWYGFI